MSAAKNTEIQDLQEIMIAIGKNAKIAASILANTSSGSKNNALNIAADIISARSEDIKQANAIDMQLGREKGLDEAMLDRLELNDTRIAAMAAGLKAIAELDDPVGHILKQWDRPNGLSIARMSVPLGVIGIIFESRPNVTADAAALCIKSGNAAILRCGSESLNSSSAIAECIHEGMKQAGLPANSVQLIPTKDRDAVGKMLTMPEYIDIIIPRGGKGLCKRIQDESRIPTLQHLDGICHSYIHEDADKDMAVEIILNAKMRRTGICGATETIVIDKSIANDFIPAITDALTAKNCEIRGDDIAQQADNRIIAADNSDWDTEYLASIISIKCVDNIKEAIEFVNTHSSHHTDAIISENTEAASNFIRGIDSAIIMHNTSTQFADGGEFGMGAEIGISTGKLHARGPVGVEQLTTYKYVVEGNGQTRP